MKRCQDSKSVCKAGTLTSYHSWGVLQNLALEGGFEKLLSNLGTKDA